MENLTIQPSILPSRDDEPISSIFCCHGFLKVPKLPARSLKSFRQKFRRRSSKIVPITAKTEDSSSSLSGQAEQVTPVPTSSTNGQIRHCWEEEANTCSNAEQHGNKSLSEKCQELSKTVSAAIGHFSKCPKLKDIQTPCQAACGSRQAEEDGDESSRACSLLLRAMTSSHALFDDIISTLNLWKVVSKKPFFKPKGCGLTEAEFVEKVTKPIRKRIQDIIKDLRRQVKLVDEMVQKADEAMDGQSFTKKFAATNDYFKEFREVASECPASKVLADFARAVSAAQMLINKCSSLSSRLSALGPEIPFAVKYPFLHKPIDGMTIKGYSLEKRLMKVIKELAEYRKAMLYVSDEVKTLDRKLKKQATKDRQKALRKKLGRKKCPRSNRVVAQLHMAKVPMMQVVNVMPCIEEVEEE